MVPFQYKGMMKGVLFERWFKTTLLQNLLKKHVIIMDIANCLEMQVKTHYTQAMSYDRDLRLRALEYAKEHGTQFLQKLVLSLNGQWHF